MSVGNASLAPLPNVSFPVSAEVPGSPDVGTFQSKSVDSIDSNLPLTEGDVGKARILSEIEKDGGKSIHDRLLKKLHLDATGPASDTVGEHVRERRSADTGQQDVSRRLTSVPVIIDPQRPLGPEDLTADDSYMRVGGSRKPDSLEVKIDRDNEVVFRMKHHDSHGNATVSADNDIGVSPCFVPRGEDVTNPDLGRAMGVFHDQYQCSNHLSSYGELSLKLQTGDEPVEGTLFSLEETVDSRLYKSADGYLSHLTPDASVATYEALKTEGVTWETGSVSPIALRVMSHDGKNYLTLQASAYYEQFNTGNQECMPSFAGAATSLNQAKCCDGVQDGKYLAVMPLPEGWFEIKYQVQKSVFSTTGGASGGEVKLWVDGELKASAFCRNGNNNQLVFGGGDLRPKFGLFDVSAKELTAKFKKTSFSDSFQSKSAYEDKWANYAGHPHVKGQCDRPVGGADDDSRNPYC
ncbi:hypothetical protein [Endozoicomonas sp. ALC013]|uniref:hypothetical protein n=1 Tax=Endozoicomonas sp. ALC013 TaxID=3403076 RepID=UPI003BB5164F